VGAWADEEGLSVEIRSFHIALSFHNKLEKKIRPIRYDRKDTNVILTVTRGGLTVIG